MGKKKTEETTAPAPVVAEESEDTAAVKALKEIDEKYCKIETEFEQEVEILRKKYLTERQAPLLAERAQVLMDTANAPADDHQYGTPACKGFWVQAMQNADSFSEALEEHDEPVLQYLQDIKKGFVDDKEPMKGLKLEFTFKENPYFTNTTLWTEYHLDYDLATYKPWKPQACIEMKGSEIDWKPGKNITVSVTAKKTKGGGAKKAKQKGKEKVEALPSLFRVLFRNLKVGDPIPEDLAEIMLGAQIEQIDEDDWEDAMKQILEQLHDLGHCTAEELVPYAVRFYTGEAGDKSDSDDDEESEEEDDDDDDDDSEDETPPAKGGKKKGGKAAPAGAAAGQKQEECKQQ